MGGSKSLLVKRLKCSKKPPQSFTVNLVPFTFTRIRLTLEKISCAMSNIGLVEGSFRHSTRYKPLQANQYKPNVMKIKPKNSKLHYQQRLISVLLFYLLHHYLLQFRFPCSAAFKNLISFSF